MNCWSRLLVAALLLGCPALVSAQVPPEKALSTFTVANGLELTLWASEPLFVNPTCMDIDHKGRVWVCESVNYRCTLHRQPLRNPKGDRIVILEDSKGQGVADKQTTFYESPEILAPLGIAVAKDPVGPGYKVFVCQSPDILLFEDKDGDGKADGPPRKFLTGFAGIDHDHGVHGILIGPDQRLYFSIGDQGVKNLKGVDGKKVWNSNGTDVRAGTIWRCDLDGRNLELIAHNFRNEYEPAVDSFGTVFVSDNDDDGNQQTRICYVMPGGNYGYHPRGKGQTHWHEEQPGVVPKVLRTFFGSPTGMCFYEGTLLPPQYHGQPLHTDAGPRHVRCYHLREQGAGYQVEQENMITSTDTWFRPSDVCVAPDGSVYIADWYDPGVGGHGMRDVTRGRIFRLAPKGHKPTVPVVDLESPKGIITALGSPALSVRYMANARLAGMKAEEVSKILAPVFKQDYNHLLWARAFQHLARRPELSQAEVEKLIDQMPSNGHDARLPLLILRVLRDRGFDPVAFLEKKFAGHLDAAVPALRRELLLLLRDVEPEKAKPAILKLAKLYDGKDRFYLNAIGIAVGHHDEARRDVLLGDFDKQFPEWNDVVADLVFELRPAVMIPRLAQVLADSKIPAVQRARVVDILAASDDKTAGPALLEVLKSDVPAEVRDKVLDNLKLYLPGKWSTLRQGKELDQTIKALTGSPQTLPAGLALIAVAGKSDAIPMLGQLARGKEDLATRKLAVQTLGAFISHESAVLLQELLAAEPAELRLEVLKALGQMSQNVGQDKNSPPGALEALAALKKMVADKGADLPQRLAALPALAGSRAGSEWLLVSQVKGELADALKGETGRLLRNSSFVDLKDKAKVIFAGNRLDPKKLPPLATLAARKGNAARGKTLLAASVKNDMQCLKCHTVRGQGGQVGPDLSVIGKKGSRENLLESILLPSKAIADQYVTWQVETKKGKPLAGLLMEETKDYLVLRDGNGKDTRIAIKDIEERTKGTKSLMPEDLLAFMTEDDVLDMVEYMLQLKTPALAMDVWHILGPFENGSGDEGLDKAFAPEKGPVDLTATYPGKGGMVRWRTVKPDAQGYVDLQAFHGSLSSNSVSYLYREIESPADQDAQVLLGVDDGCKLWINDQLVHTDRQHRAALPEQDSVAVKLRKGVNRILFKINNGDGPHGFYFTLLAEQELKRLGKP